MEPVGINGNVPHIIFHVGKSSHHITSHRSDVLWFMTCNIIIYEFPFSVISVFSTKTQITIIKKHQQQSQNMKLLFIIQCETWNHTTHRSLEWHALKMYTICVQHSIESSHDCKCKVGHRTSTSVIKSCEHTQCSQDAGRKS